MNRSLQEERELVAEGAEKAAENMPGRKRKGTLSRKQVILARSIAVGGLLLAWWGTSRFYPALIPGPFEVARQVWDWTLDGTLWENARVTLLEVGVGFCLAVIAGVILGWLMAYSKWLNAGLRPVVDVLNAIPRIGLAPLFILWFGIGVQSKVALIFSVVVFIVLINVQAGIESVEEDYLLLARSLGAGKRDIAFKILLPAVAPWLIASLRLGAAYAVAAAVVGEFIAANSGIGFLLAYRSAVLDKTGAFAALLILALGAWFFTLGTMWLEKRVLRWRTAGIEGGFDGSGPPTVSI